MPMHGESGTEHTDSEVGSPSETHKTTTFPERDVAASARMRSRRVLPSCVGASSDQLGPGVKQWGGGQCWQSTQGDATVCRCCFSRYRAMKAPSSSKSDPPSPLALVLGHAGPFRLGGSVILGLCPAKSRVGRRVRFARMGLGRGPALLAPSGFRGGDPCGRLSHVVRLGATARGHGDIEWAGRGGWGDAAIIIDGSGAVVACYPPAALLLKDGMAS